VQLPEFGDYSYIHIKMRSMFKRILSRFMGLNNDHLALQT
jgi:hypothetical protein